MRAWLNVAGVACTPVQGPPMMTVVVVGIGSVVVVAGRVVVVTARVVVVDLGGFRVVVVPPTAVVVVGLAACAHGGGAAKADQASSVRASAGRAARRMAKTPRTARYRQEDAMRRPLVIGGLAKRRPPGTRACSRSSTSRPSPLGW